MEGGRGNALEGGCAGKALRRGTGDRHWLNKAKRRYLVFCLAMTPGSHTDLGLEGAPCERTEFGPRRLLAIFVCARPPPGANGALLFARPLFLDRTPNAKCIGTCITLLLLPMHRIAHKPNPGQVKRTFPLLEL